MKDAKKTPTALRFSKSASMPEAIPGPKLNSKKASFLPSKQWV